jgi:protein TonB
MAQPTTPKHERNAIGANTAPLHSAPVAPVAPATVSRGPAAAAPNAAQQLAQAEAQVSASLRQALRAHFSYPLLARQRGWAGLVQLGLRVESDGRLSHVRVLESSGYGLLDRAALASVRAIGVVPQALRWLHGHHFDIVLPVEYRLLDS